MRIHTPQAILHFWFKALTPEQWFMKDLALDQRIRQQFLSTTQAAAKALYAFGIGYYSSRGLSFILSNRQSKRL